MNKLNNSKPNAKEIYFEAYSNFEKKNHTALLESCRTLFTKFPDSREAKLALKNFGITWNKVKQSVSFKPTDFPMGWFKFYTYVRLPFGIIGLSIIAVVGFYSNDMVMAYGNAIYALFFLVLFFGLHKKSLWGWKLNWIALVIDPLLFPLRYQKEFNGASYIVGVVIWSIIWFWPNYIYFKKRRASFMGIKVKAFSQTKKREHVENFSANEEVEIKEPVIIERIEGVSWKCPECGNTNEDYLIRCACGYEIEE